jgi:hypothetical protein
MDKTKTFFAKWWLWVLSLIIITTVVSYGLHLAGIVGERVAFQQSFQYQEARKSEIATYSAQLAAINRQLQSEHVEASTKTNLQSQADSLRILINAAQEK